MAKYELPPLPYDFGALEPAISGQIMELHYTKHHQAYVNNLNAALEKYQEAEKIKDLPAMIALEPAIRFNGGGNLNHSIFWTNLAPVKAGGGVPPKGDLLKAIDLEFGQLATLTERLSTAAIGVQGSGWAWLGYDKVKKRLVISTTANQDPLVTQGLVPLLGIDVWEHAYYLQYKNVRADYVKNIWQVVNWGNVEERFSNTSK
jgi:Fe-Mn family superoxide dismutase